MSSKPRRDFLESITKAGPFQDWDWLYKEGPLTLSPGELCSLKLVKRGFLIPEEVTSVSQVKYIHTHTHTHTHTHDVYCFLRRQHGLSFPGNSYPVRKLSSRELWPFI